MRRNNITEGLLRGARQVPDWWDVGGRPNAYALEWIGSTTSTDFYTRSATAWNDMTTITVWARLTTTLSIGARRGLFGMYDSTLAQDRMSLIFIGDATHGNCLEIYHLGNRVATINNIGTTWHNYTIHTAGNVNFYMDNSIVWTGNAPALGPLSTYTLGRTERITGTVETLQNCIVDELAFFDTAQNVGSLYNGGVPLIYTPSHVGLDVSYEVEKQTGSIKANNLFPSVYSGLTIPPTFNWHSGTPTGIVEITTDTLRSIDTNPYAELSANYGLWVSGSPVSGRHPIGSAIDLTAEANGLMPYPAGGGYSTTGYTGAFVGNEDEPDATPRTTVSGNFISSDSTEYPSVGGTDSLGRKLDIRPQRLFVPRFVKR